MNTKLLGGLFIIVLLSFGVLAASEMGYVQIPFSITGSYFVKPQWSRLECAPTDTWEGQFTDQISGSLFSTDSSEIYCAEGRNTDMCRLFVKPVADTWIPSGNIDVEYRICDANSCGSWDAELIPWDNKEEIDSITKDQYMEIRGIGGWFGTGFHIDIEGLYKPWKLYRYDGGAKYEQKAYDCCLTTQLKARIPDQELSLECLTMTGGIGSKWVNYVEDWVYGPATHIYNYNNQEVYCRAATLYDIVELEMGDGTLVKINPDYNPPADAPDYIQGIGNIVAYVECCPYESGCTDNFEYDGTGGGDSCFSDTQCFNGGAPVPYTSSSYKLQFCNDDNVCEWSNEIMVECTSNAACPPGQICDLSLTNYGTCIQQGDAPYCGDGYCDRTESKESCPADCGDGGGFSWGDWEQWLIFIVMGALGALLGYLVNKKDRVLWAGFGGLIGIIAAFAIKWVFDNWLALTLAGVLGTAGAGISIYFVGPTLIILIMLLQGRGTK